MDVFKEGKYFRYVEKAPIWLTISLFVIIAGIVFMAVSKMNTGSYFNLSIHYTGGEKVILKFSQELEIDGQEVKEIVQQYAAGEAIVQVYADDPRVASIKLRVPEVGASETEISRNRAKSVHDLKEELGEKFGGYVAVTEEGGATPNPETLEESHVGPTIGAELIRNTILALIFGCVLIMLYILLRFHRWQMSLAAIGALIHDVLVTLGFTAALGLEVSDSFIAVILTIIGYSINDTIIIFDRIRENVRNYGEDAPLAQVCNLSLNQTLVRSLNTVITVIIMIVALIVFGGANLRDFLVAMLIGMISGGYSSIFVATPLMLWFSRGKLKLAPEPVLGMPLDDVELAVPEQEVETTVSKTISSAVESKKQKKRTKKQRRR